MLDLTNVIQTSTGSTGSSAVATSVTPTLPNPTTAGNGVYVAIVVSPIALTPPAGFSLFDPGGGSGNLQFMCKCKDTPGGETSWTFTFGSAAQAVWFAMEFDGGMSMDTRDPDNSPFSLASDLYQYTWNAASAASTVNSGASINNPPIWGDAMSLAFVSAYKASGVPPTVTGTPTNTVDGTAPTWTSLVPTTVTTVGTNDLRTDVFYAFSSGSLHRYACKPTWTGVTDQLVSQIEGFRGFFDPPQRVNPRAALNSMM